MKKSKFTEAQIIYALRQAEGGTKVAEVCRKMGISEATFYELEEEVWWRRHNWLRDSLQLVYVNQIIRFNQCYAAN